MGSHYWKDVKHMFKAYLRMEDTGGQPELMDTLPALTVGPGVYLLFINLQNDLDHHFKLTYFKSSHKKTPPTVSIYTVKKLLLRISENDLWEMAMQWEKAGQLVVVQWWLTYSGGMAVDST